jgi:hypothetical protein
MFPGGTTTDDLTLNYPLRVLAGELLRHGRLPLWNPYIWSGTPLLAGWNAGALYPGTWLFAVLPAGLAWTINIISVSVVCGIGMHVFLRHLGCSPLASLLAALTFTYTGFMSGQAQHIGLTAGIGFIPWMLLAVHELGASPGPRAARRWIALLAGCGGLAVLAGDPRAASCALIAVLTYSLAICWRAWRARRPVTIAAAGVVLAALLVVALSAAQWLPGLAFVHESQRGAVTLTRFAAGSLTWHDLTLLFVPFLVGGHGRFGLPSFAGSYNLPELSYAVGIMPLVAAFAFIWRAVRRRAGNRQLGVWYILVLVGVILSAGANMPLGGVLASIPLYGGQRLQNRNAVLVDFGLAVLLALFVDVLAPRITGRGSASDDANDADPKLELAERLAGLVPVGIVVFLIAAAYLMGRWVQRLLGVYGYNAGLASGLTPYFVTVLVISIGAAALVVAAPRLGPARCRRLVAVVVAADVLLALVSASFSIPAKTTVTRENPAVTTLAKLLGAQGRYAIYNPEQELPGRLGKTLLELGPYSLGILHQLPSVQGYSSAVAGDYDAATGAHAVESLQASGLASSTLDVLNLRDLLTIPEYLVAEIRGNKPIPVPQGTPVPPGTELAARQLDPIGPGTPLPSIPPFLLSPGRSSTWMLPGPVALDSATIVLLPYHAAVPRVVSVGLLNERGQIVAEHDAPVSGSRIHLVLSGRVVYGILVLAPSQTSLVVGAVAVTTVHPFSVSPGLHSRRLVLNQILQGVLEPSHWRYQTDIGGVLVFANSRARGAAWVEPAGSTTPDASLLSGAHASTAAVAPWRNSVTVVSTPRQALLVRGVTYEKGWVAKITPASGGETLTVPVRQLAMVQAVSIPPGKYLVTWVYNSTLAKLGLLASALGTVAIVLLVFTPRRRRKLAQTPEPVDAK